MEEQFEGCSLIYYCPSTHGIVSSIYHPSHPPPASSASHETPAHLYKNVRRLLDVDQGNFAQVFLSSKPESCLEQLTTFAKTNPTAVLVEFSHVTADDNQNSAVDFLRRISDEVQSSRYERPVMPFVLLAPSSPQDAEPLAESAFETSYLSAYALDTMQSPLCSEAINQLVGHVKETTRPSAPSLGAGMAQSLVSSIVDTSEPQLASHRPDELLSAQRKKAVEDAVANWKFPAHEFDMDELTYGALFMLEHVLRNPALEQHRLSRAELMTFLLAARRQYKHEREVHYHNWRHAVDVTQSLYCFLCDVRLCPPSPTSRTTNKEVNPLEKLLSPHDALTLLVSAIGHDVGHPGVNNAFLVACNHQLAGMYNDKSVLENYHCAAYSQLLRRHWPSLVEIPHFRPTMISTILATDMQRHFEYMGHLKELKTKIEGSDDDLADWSDKDKDHARELIMALLLKAADISNVARPFDVSAQWAKILMNEFARQGELENELQIPTCLFGGPPNKEDLLAAAQSQKGFMNLFGFPLFRGISEVMPNVSCTIPELEKNKNVWEARIVDEKARKEARGDGRKSPRTYGSVTEAEVEEARTRKRESEPIAVPTEVPQTPTSPNSRQPVMERQGQPASHPASEQRHHLQLGLSPNAEEKRSSTPVIWPSSLQSPTGGSSRRSSKDVALNSIQEWNPSRGQGNLAPAGSRRGSADAGWQIHQNYPGSRRGSKDESLTTILVTSQGSPASLSVPSSPKVGKPPSPNKATGSGKKQPTPKQSSSTVRHSVPSSTSQTTTSATVTTDQESSSTHPSSLATTDDEVPPGAVNSSSGVRGEPESFGQSPEWLDHLEGGHHSSAPAALPSTPPDAGFIRTIKPDSPRVMSRMASGDSGVSASRLDPRKSEPHIRQSRSRSRLRGLKFWKKRNVTGGVDGPAAGSTSP
ncbi:hypothetical protein PRZ48_001050 [Zasmidium cellare]|uniref:Phosphodiesterase n=1 Tax=Zasmidium cellare TaxID=395010 RepID=A0ABR0F1Z3_ZASCE|nr:hypothetical protein PRZ48_001050 [Zasmidium cellare]